MISGREAAAGYLWAQPDAWLEEGVACGEEEKGKGFMESDRIHGKGSFQMKFRIIRKLRIIRRKWNCQTAWVRQGADGIHESL